MTKNLICPHIRLTKTLFNIGQVAKKPNLSNLLFKIYRKNTSVNFKAKSIIGKTSTIRLKMRSPISRSNLIKLRLRTLVFASNSKKMRYGLSSFQGRGEKCPKNIWRLIWMLPITKQTQINFCYQAKINISFKEIIVFWEKT